MIELGGMIAISIGWQPDGHLRGNRQPLNNTAVLVVRDANDHKGSSSSCRVHQPVNSTGVRNIVLQLPAPAAMDRVRDSGTTAGRGFSTESTLAFNRPKATEWT